MSVQPRRHLNREAIDNKVEEVIRYFDSSAFTRIRSPLYDVVKGLKERHSIPFLFDQDLGYSKNGKKILGRFDFKPRRIKIDRILPYDSPRFRWTLGHELGHFVLHRNIDPQQITIGKPEIVDTRIQLRFARTAQRSELDWVEWQANQFASAILLPQNLVHQAIVKTQSEFGIPKPGRIYLDDQPWNIRDYIRVLREASAKLGVSRTVLRIRLFNLGILVDGRRGSRNHVQDALKSLFSEDNSEGPAASAT